MNYYPFHIGDYRSHTAHLTRTQDLAYRRLLDLYYMHERALSADPVQCARRIGMSDCLDDVRIVLEDFFELAEDGHHNRRCDEILEDFASRREKAQRAGRASGEARRTRACQEEDGAGQDGTDADRKFASRPTIVQHASSLQATDGDSWLSDRSSDVERTLNERSTDVQQTLNDCSTDAQRLFNECSPDVQPTNNQNQKPKQRQHPPLPPLDEEVAAGPVCPDQQPGRAGAPPPRGAGKADPTASGGPARRQTRADRPQAWSGVHVPCPPDVPEDLWRDFCRLRKAKGAPVTETVLAGIRREAGRAGASIEAALGFMVERGHQGFIVEAWRRAHEGVVPAGRRIPATEDLAAINYGPGGPL